MESGADEARGRDEGEGKDTCGSGDGFRGRAAKCVNEHAKDVAQKVTEEL